MKFGFRKPNLEKKIKARTSGALKRKVKKTVNPFYGKKGMGLINNPSKALYNKIYSKTTMDPLKTKKAFSSNSSIDFNDVYDYINTNAFLQYIDNDENKERILCSTVNAILAGKLEDDEDIIEFLQTTSNNVKINSKLLPFLTKFIFIPALIIIVIILILILI